MYSREIRANLGYRQCTAERYESIWDIVNVQPRDTSQSGISLMHSREIRANLGYCLISHDLVRSEAIDTVVVGTLLVLARMSGLKQNVCSVDSSMRELLSAVIILWQDKLHHWNPRTHSAATRVAGNAAFYVTELCKCWETVEHATF